MLIVRAATFASLRTVRERVQPGARIYESAPTIQYVKAAFDVTVPNGMCGGIGVEIVEANSINVVPYEHPRDAGYLGEDNPHGRLPT
jgi:hypothetical protein